MPDPQAALSMRGDTDRLTLNLLRFYQRELHVPTPATGSAAPGNNEAPGITDARDAMEKIQITDPTLVDRYGLGYCSGKALDAMSDGQRQQLIDTGLVHRRPMGEMMKGCVVLPVYNEHGALVDLCGLRPWKSGLRFVHWQPTHQGLIGSQSLNMIEADSGSTSGGEAILCDNAFHFLHAAQNGYQNVLAIRSTDELAGHLNVFERIGLRRVYLVSRQQRHLIGPALQQHGIAVVMVRTPPQVVVPPSCYQEALGRGSYPKQKPSNTARPVVNRGEGVEAPPPEPDEPADLHLVKQTDARLMFEVGSIRYTIDSTAMTGLAMRVQVRVVASGKTCIDKVDLGSASARRKASRHLASAVGLSSDEVEQHLNSIAEQIDRLILDAAELHTKGTKHEQPLSDVERDAALAILRNSDVLAYFTDALDQVCGYVGEDHAKRLALLVAASRLLPQPLGALFRGPAGSGKSALMKAVMQTLPLDGVLYFSRLTAQALYFLPGDQLKHRLLVCDEYEGLVDSEYALRSLMSSQVLSLAITVREGGRVPVTRTIEVPATLAVMVSTTGPINAENLSRFIEIGLNTSADQTRRILGALATPPSAKPKRMREVRAVSRLLRPCSVVIPYADQLIGEAGTVSVTARRRFGHVIGLIAAHAALHQHQRPRKSDPALERSNNTTNADTTLPGPGVIEATPADYAAVYPLLSSIVEHAEEDVSPPAMALLRHIQDAKLSRLTRQQVMDAMNWSYSRAYKVLRELSSLDLLRPDTTTNGVLRTYEVSAFHLTEQGVGSLVPPEALPPEVVATSVETTFAGTD